MAGPEQIFSVTPTIDTLVGLGYNFLSQDQNELARDGLNQVLLRDEFIASVQRLNDVPEEVARAAYSELLGVRDNERWTRLLRGDYSRTIPGQPEKKTIKLIDFLHSGNNTFTVTEELTVEAQKTRRADLVVYANGIPLVVIECKSPLSPKDKTGEAFDQIKQYELDIPRLFYSNAFSIVTNGHSLLYGATDADRRYWASWKDPWPKTRSDFANDVEMGLWSLLAPERLLDILAHFIVFERDATSGKTIKKMCRYQQFRAVNKMVERVVDGKQRRGLVWHTQGSGKSLTMAFAAIKLKTHRTLDAPELANPNLLVLTDRIQLDDQLAQTFQACGVRNARQIKLSRELLDELHSPKRGLTLLSMIYKFQDSATAAAASADWIVLVDECHRTQEKDLGAYMRATLPEARFFGFTGTPVKSNDLDTYRNFGAPGEGYLDRYSIDDAVADGATVPIRYTGSKTEWSLDGRKLDILFDREFEELGDEQIEEIKRSGATFSTLVKHEDRIGLIAFDIWTHYLKHAYPDGLKAQLAALDREAVVLYKEALDEVITEHFVKEGLSPAEARERAEAFSVCVYSTSQTDGHVDEDPHVDRIRGLLRRHALENDDESDVVEAFKKPDQPPYMLIVCDKLLTGFDAPIEAVMYLDKPLKEHGLLQAIARTNRVYGPSKQYGLIVDYIGVTRRLDEALASYRQADVENAMRDLDELQGALVEAHAVVLPYIEKCRIVDGRYWRERLKDEYDNLVQELASKDEWFRFEQNAQRFIKAYEAVSPDPFVLTYTDDLKWVASFLPWGRLHFEGKSDVSLQDVSAKIRQMLDEHLEVSGIRTVCKLRRLTDPDFLFDMGKAAETSEKDLETAAVRKTAELKKEIMERLAENEARYRKFSDRLLEIIAKFDQGLTAEADKIDELQKLALEIKAEDDAHKETGLSREAFGVLRILEAHRPADSEQSPLEVAAQAIDDIYRSDETAPLGWSRKSELRKELRGKVRRVVFPLGLKDWRDIPALVDEFAMRYYAKV